MLKGIQSGLGKFFTREKVVLFLALIILSWGIFSYSGSKNLVLDQMSNNSSMNMNVGNSNYNQMSAYSPSNAPVQHQPQPQPQPQQNNNTSEFALQPVTNPSDLLPQDQNSQWAALNPVSMNQGNMNMPDLLQAGYHIGLDTIGQTLRNANQQLRSDPIIPIQTVGPWNQSTIEPDLGRTPLEIGQ